MLEGYKSPPHKLVKVFKEGRDNWKQKAEARQAELTNVKQKYAYQKEKVQALKKEVTELKAKLSQAISPLSIKKKTNKD